MLISIVEHSATQFVLDQAIQSEEKWKEYKENLNQVESLIDFFKTEHSFHYLSFQQQKKENSEKQNNSSSTYPRMLCFLLSLMKQLGIDVVIGKSDFRRIWTICEVFCGYAICKDIIIPPIYKSNEYKESWTMVIELIIPLINNKFNFLSKNPIDSPLHKLLIQNLQSRISTTTNNHPIDFYSASYILRKLIQGNNDRSEAFLRFYLPTLNEDILSCENHNNNVLLYYQTILPEIFGYLKYNQCVSLELTKLFQSIVSHIMNENLNVIELEALIHLTSLEDGILSNNDHSQVISSLFVFFNEWNENENKSLFNNLQIRIQIIRLCLSLSNHSNITENMKEYYHFFNTFIQNSFKNIEFNFNFWNIENNEKNNQIQQSCLFYSLKFSKFMIQFFQLNNNIDFTSLYSWLFNIFISICGFNIPIPYLQNLFNCLCHSILSIDISLFDFQSYFNSSKTIEISCFKLLNSNYFSLQKSSFYILSAYMKSKKLILNNDHVNENNNEYDNTNLLLNFISTEFFEKISNQDFCFLKNDDWLIFNESIESEEIGYFYRIGLIDLVSYCFSWLLFCDLYHHQPLELKRIISSCLRSSVSSLLSFFFNYVQHRSINLTPTEINIRAFDPYFIDSLDKFLCDLYLKILQVFPSLVREWWCTDCTRALTNFVETFTTKNISPTLISTEIQIIQDYQHDFDNFEIKPNAQIKQVKAFYEEDEVQLGSL